MYIEYTLMFKQIIRAPAHGTTINAGYPAARLIHTYLYLSKNIQARLRCSH